METIELAPVPVEEECEQLGENYNPSKARKECRVFRNQLMRMVEKNFPGREVDIMIKSNLHEYGIYLELAIKFDENDERSVDLAYWIDSNLPQYWDEEAKKELEGV